MCAPSSENNAAVTRRGISPYAILEAAIADSRFFSREWQAPARSLRTCRPSRSPRNAKLAVRVPTWVIVGSRSRLPRVRGHVQPNGTPSRTPQVRSAGFRSLKLINGIYFPRQCQREFAESICSAASIRIRALIRAVSRARASLVRN